MASWKTRWKEAVLAREEAERKIDMLRAMNVRAIVALDWALTGGADLGDSCQSGRLLELVKAMRELERGPNVQFRHMASVSCDLCGTVGYGIEAEFIEGELPSFCDRCVCEMMRVVQTVGIGSPGAVLAPPPAPPIEYVQKPGWFWFLKADSWRKKGESK